jgi:dihydroneopterin aldolase
MSAALPFPAPPASRPQSRITALKVFVRALRIDVEIGVNADEYGRRQPLVIDVELDLVPPERCEHIGETVNYEAVVRHARALASAGHVKLIETFAQRLAEAMMDEAHVVGARVRIEKPQALAEHAEAAGVEITLAR